MQKLFKRFSVVIMALAMVVCLAACATACTNGNDEEQYATDTFTVTVLDENGNPIDGTNFGQEDFPDDNGVYPTCAVKIQFCTLNGGCTPKNPEVGADGKVTIELSDLKMLAPNGETIELHVLYVEGKGYKKEYGQYKVDKIPLEITVTLALKAA